MCRYRTLFAAALVAFSASVACGQPKPGYDPSSTHIFPAGGRRGTTVAVRVGTECAPPFTRFRLSGEGVTAPGLLEKYAAFRGAPSPRRLPTEIPITYPREWESQITIAADAPLGTVFWRLSSSQGGTASRPFVIGDLPEVVETESNSSPEKAEAISLPITVNGQINGERDVDYFRFHAEAGDTIACEVMARRLGSALDPLVELLDDRGRPLQVDEAYLGDDPVLVLRAPQDGEYFLRVANVTFHGSAADVYRINLSKQPFLLSAFPSGGQVGTEQSLSLYALDGSGKPQVVEATVALPTESKLWQYRHADFSGVVTLALSESHNVIESEENDSREQAMELAISSTVHGRFLTKDDQDWFRCAAKRDQQLTVLCQADRLGGSCLPEIAILDSAGKQLASAASVEATDRVARVQWRVPADGDYFIRAGHLRQGLSGGPNYIYRLTIEPARPGLELRLPSDNINLTQGGTSNIDIQIRRVGNFNGPIEFSLDGLPAGLTAENTTVAAGKSNAKIKLTAADDVRVQSYPLRIVGRAKVDGQPMEAVARAEHLGRDSEGVSIGPATVGDVQLTIRHKPVFRLYCAEAYQYAHRGTIYPYAMQIERLNGFDGEITVQQGDRQNRDLDGIEFLTTVIPPAESDFMMPIYLPETMHINVQSQSQLYTQAYTVFTDQHGQRQSMLVLSEKRNMIRTLPPVVKLEAVDKVLNARPGETVPCRLHLERTTNFGGPMEVTLIDPVEPGVRCAKQTIAAGASDVAMEIAVTSEMTAASIPLRFRAVGILLGETRVVTEATVQLTRQK